MRTIINVLKPYYELLNKKSKTKYGISLKNLAPKNWTESSDKPLLSIQIWKTHKPLDEPNSENNMMLITLLKVTQFNALMLKDL
jgi:hypothetical protein